MNIFIINLFDSIKIILSLKQQIVLWIDHRKCLIVFINTKKIGIKIIKSNIDKKIKPIEEKNTSAPIKLQILKADDHQVRPFAGKLNIYFNKIISIIKNAKYIQIFGPDMAKDKLLKRIKRIKRIKPDGYIEDIEATDRMTGVQIIAKVKQHYCV